VFLALAAAAREAPAGADVTAAVEDFCTRRMPHAADQRHRGQDDRELPAVLGAARRDRCAARNDRQKVDRAGPSNTAAPTSGDPVRRVFLALAAVPATIVALAPAATADTVIVPSQHVEVGPVSTDTPAVTRTHEDEDLVTSVARCASDPQVSPTAIGCPQ
jgi:hypothetical protein